MFEQIHYQLIKWFSEYRDLDINTKGILISHIVKKFQTLSGQTEAGTASVQ